MSYSRTQLGERGLSAFDVDYDEFDELCAMDIDELEEFDMMQELGLGQLAPPTRTMAPTSTSTTGTCPPDREWDPIEQMCKIKPTSAEPFDPLKLASAPLPEYKKTSSGTVASQPMAPVATAPVAPTPAPPDTVRATDVLLPRDAPPILPRTVTVSSSAPSSAPVQFGPPPTPIKPLTLPGAPSAPSSGLSAKAMVGIGVGVGLGLLGLYLVTRK